MHRAVAARTRFASRLAGIFPNSAWVVAWRCGNHYCASSENRQPAASIPPLLEILCPFPGKTSDAAGQNPGVLRTTVFPGRLIAADRFAARFLPVVRFSFVVPGFFRQIAERLWLRCGIRPFG